MINETVKRFVWNTSQPWEILRYKLVWSQLTDFINDKNLKILDFGSGLGITANYLARDNDVTAIEPDEDMIKERYRENNYTQIHGKFEKLKDFSDGLFDVIVCHNVLHFADERADIVKEFSRIVKNGGILSIITHNKNGKIMFKAIFENNVDEAISLFSAKESLDSFGKMTYFTPEDIVTWGDNLKIEKILGSNMLGRLQQNNEIKYAPEWLDKMFEIEKMICDLEPYKNIGYNHHVLLKKI